MPWSNPNICLLSMLTRSTTNGTPELIASDDTDRVQTSGQPSAVVTCQCGGTDSSQGQSNDEFWKIG
ncbi:hypothetical protein E2C01_028567 [Portunus trituberculatus]|uniref:Uncharacterized protein n=1 Tax=Portunus trituberculatus TaxID=210409 RepID=A0A5B7EPS9_PORTR|nr:hypothetical protein [Portunus trituberculatus]